MGRFSPFFVGAFKNFDNLILKSAADLTLLSVEAFEYITARTENSQEDFVFQKHRVEKPSVLCQVERGNEESF